MDNDLKPLTASSQLNSSLIPHSSSLANGLVVRSPNWLGDVIMALPAMCCLKKMLPHGSGFFVVCPENLATLFEAIPWVTRIIPVGSGHSKWTAAQIKSVKELHAYAGFLFVNSLRSAWYFRRAGVKKLYGASNGMRNVLMTRHFKVRWHEDGKYSDIHQSEKYLSMAYALGAQEWDRKYPDFKLMKLDEISMPELKSMFLDRDGEKILAVAPGAAYGPAKRWSSEFYNKVCRYWICERNGKVIVVGAKNEYDTAMEVTRNLPPGKVCNVTGKTSMKELLYILKNSYMCLCNDSGVMHLGSALSINGIAIFGSTDPYATGPLSPKWSVMIKPQQCAPCFSRECINHDANYKCLYSIKPEDVCREIDKRISQIENS